MWEILQLEDHADMQETAIEVAVQPNKDGQSVIEAAVQPGEQVTLTLTDKIIEEAVQPKEQ
jgi:hypothetical protein